VAELSAAVLCQIVGKTSKVLGNSYQYIERYASQARLKVLSVVESVLNFIVKKRDRRGVGRHLAGSLILNTR
jgi:hypothetical protein